MVPLGLRTAAVVLDEVYAKYPYLPHPEGLPRLIVDAHNSGDPGGLAGVVGALWPVAAADGAVRGHAATLTALLELIERIDTDTLVDARARWVAAAFRHAALDLPVGPDPAKTYALPTGGGLFPVLSGLRQAVELGLSHGWRDGHYKAAQKLLADYGDALEDLVGRDRLVTTFLVAGVPAHVLLEEIDFLAYRFAETDREDPTGRSDPVQVMAASLDRFGLTTPPTAATRGFPPLRRLEPRPPRRRRPRPIDGPSSRRPGR